MHFKSGILKFLTFGYILGSPFLAASSDTLFSAGGKASKESKDQARVPHEMEAFLDKWNKSIEGFESSYKEGNSKGSITDRFLDSITSAFSKHKSLSGEKSFEELSIDPKLDAKLSTLVEKKKDESKTGEKPEEQADTKTEQKHVTFSQLQEILKNKSGELTSGEKTRLAALLMLRLEKSHKGSGHTGKAMKALLADYLNVMDKLSPETEVPLSAELKKHLGISEKDGPKALLPKNISKLIEEKGVPSSSEGLDLLSSLIKSSLGSPESLGLAFEPIWKQLFESNLASSEPTIIPSAPKTFQEGLDLLDRRDNNAPIPKLDSPLSSQVTPIIPKAGGSRGGGRHRGPKPRSSGPRAGKSGGGGSFGGRNLGPVPDSTDSPQLLACVTALRKKRFNVELSLPRSLCSSTAISVNPKDEAQSCLGKRPNERRRVNLSTALHCVQNVGNLIGRSIGLQIGDNWISAPVTFVGNPDGSNGTAIRNGNPDLALIEVEVPCSQAPNLNFARIPSEAEINALSSRSNMPLVIQQNSSINASKAGGNAATIAATANWEQRGRGNFIRFNSNSDFNNSSGQDVGPGAFGDGRILDSNRIKPGDSGGPGLTCNVDDRGILRDDDAIYIGATSTIDVRGDNNEGQVGSLASGQSLRNLSRALRGDSDTRVAKASEPSDAGEVTH